MGAERKYTDRDVREMENVDGYVREYLEHYQGEFDFLVDCKMRVASGVELSIGMMRGVLNCMRSDPRVRTQLPEPLAPNEMATVVRMRPKRRMSHPGCDITELHAEHSLPETDEFYGGYCTGNYSINREYTVDMVSTIKVPYLAAQSPTSLMHKADGEGWMRFFPNRHEWGFSSMYEPDVFARPACKMPRVIKNPILLTEEQMNEMQSDEDTSRARCHRCFA